MSQFQLDDRLAKDSEFIMISGLCDLRLMKDFRWPWLVLVPRRPDVTEIFDLTPLDQVLLTFETELAASALKKLTGATKINIGALGNIVRQLHVHIIARCEGDANWPGLIWGYGRAEAYDASKKDEFLARLREALSS